VRYASGSLAISLQQHRAGGGRRKKLEIDYGGAALDIGFNVTYLLDALVQHSGATAVRRSPGRCELSSVLVTHADDSGFRYVVMPMRI
jgi:DNA polymerase-3 subunit beta